MSVNALLDKIKAADTMPKLDDMRLELVQAGKQSPDDFRTLQDAFIKQKNKLQRVPLRDRAW